MIRLIDATGEHHPVTGYEDFHVTHKEDGMDRLTFEVDVHSEVYPFIQNECEVITDDNSWLVKKIDDDKIECDLNFDFAKTQVYADFSSKTRSLIEVLADHLPQDWAVERANVSTIRRTIEMDCATDFDVIYECMNTYGVRFAWDIKRKRLKVYSPDQMQPTGEYLTSELNLRKVSFKGSSVDFATRLYCYGQGNISIADAMVPDGQGGTVRYGKPYLEDHTYAEKIVSAYWKDDRYSIPDHLYEAAQGRLKSLSIPVIAYECDVQDLAKIDSRYSFLDFAMFKKVTLMDPDRQLRVDYQIVEYDEWPDEPERNGVTLSSVPGTIQSSLKKIASGSSEEIKQAQSNMEQKITMATAMLTGVFGGHVITNGSEIFIMDTEDPSTAKIVWRWNVNGFGKSSTGIDGPYTTALTFDDTFITNVIEAMVIKGSYIEAESIQAKSINQSYTDGVLQQSYTAAEGLVKYTAQDIREYLTTPEGTGQLDVLKKTITNIQQTIDGLKLDFSDQYEGGINYIRNSSGLNGLSDDWERTGTVTTQQNGIAKNNTVAGCCFEMSAESTLKQTIDNLIVGSTYTVKLRAKKTASLLSIIKIQYNSDQEEVLLSSSESSDWTEYICTIHSIQSPVLTFSAETRSSYLYLADIMVYEGTNPRSWTPAPNEIYASGVTVDSRGIEVYRSETSEKTAITNREFAGYYNGEKVFSLNKDETRTKNTVVNGTLRVGDLRFIPYAQGSETGVNVVLID